MRSELLAGDSSATLGLLMKFPEMHDLSPIFSIISDIRRCLDFFQRSHYYSAVLCCAVLYYCAVLLCKERSILIHSTVTANEQHL